MNSQTELEAFKKSGETEEVTGIPSTPVVELTRKENGFFRGIFQSRRELKESKVGRSALSFTFNKTNAKVTKKKGDQYPEVSVSEGDNVTIFAPTQLDRKFKDVSPGTEVFILYLGKKTDVIKGKKVTSHRFDVRVKVNGNNILESDVVDTVPF